MALCRRAGAPQLPWKLPQRVTCGWPRDVAPRQVGDERAASVMMDDQPDDAGYG